MKEWVFDRLQKFEWVGRKVSQLANDEALCLSLSARARDKASHFSQAFGQALRESLNLQEAKKSKV